MKILTLIIITLITTSCDRYYDLSELTNPIIVIAKDSLGAILSDKYHKLYLAKHGYYDGSPIIKSYNVGDTLKYIKP